MLLTVTLNASVDRAYSFEQLTLGNIHRANNVIARAGGKGNNVARVAAQLGMQVTATGLVGGSTGEFITRQLLASGVKPAFTFIEGESRTCLALTEKSGQITEILENGPTVTPSEFDDFKRNFAQLCPKNNYVVISGSLPHGVPTNAYQQLIRIAQDKGCQVALDAQGEALYKGIRAYPWLLKINKSELEGLLDTTLADQYNITVAVKELNLAQIVIITLGSKGSILYNSIDKTTLYSSGPLVKVKNSVGSGDSFMAGFIAYQVQGATLATSLRYANACGASNATMQATGEIDIYSLRDLYSSTQIRIV